MSLQSFIGSKLHLQLHKLAHLHLTIPALTAFVLLASLHLVPNSSSTVLSRPRLNRFTKSATATSAFQRVMHALTTTCLRIRITVQLPMKCRDYATYPTPQAEARYWRDAARYRRRLYSGGAHIREDNVGTPSYAGAQLVEYYTPRLLPLYRERESCAHLQRADEKLVISLKMYCKWHRMVFPLRPYLTLKQASQKMKQHSPGDLREILRISRLRSSEQLIRVGTPHGKQECITKYRKMWESYLDRKSMDLAIVFE